MSQIDSASSLRSKDRAAYYKEQQRAKEKYDKDLDAQKNRFEKVTDSRNEKFQNDILEMKDNYDKKFDDLRSKSAENLKKFQKNVQHKTTKEQEENLSNIAQERENFQRRVEDLNISYNKELLAKEKRNNIAESTLKNNFKSNLNKKEEDFTKHTSDLKYKQDLSTRDLLNQSQVEKNKLEKSYNDILQKQASSELKKRQMDNSAFKTVLDKKEMDSKADLELKELQKDAAITDVRSDANAILEKRILDEKRNNEKLVSSQSRDMQRERDLHHRQMSQSNMDHLLEKRIRDYQTGRKEEILQRAKDNGLSTTPKEKNQEAEIVRWKNRNTDMDEKFNNQQELYVDNIKLLKNKNIIESGNALQKKDVESDNRVMDVLAAERLKHDKTQSIWESKSLADKEIHDRMNRQNEKVLKQRVNNLSETYTQRLQDLNEKNSNLLVGLKREHLHDKKEFAVNIETQFNRRQMDLVKDFERKQDLLMSEYEKKIIQLEAQNNELMLTMQQNTSKIRREENQKLINQQDMLADQKKDSERSIRELMVAREKELKNTITKLHEDYSRRIEEQETSFKTRINTLTTNYEQKIFQLQRTTSHEVNLKNNEIVKERKSLLAAFEDEKKRLSDQYENVIKNMKTAHNDHLNNLERYKKMNEKLPA